MQSSLIVSQNGFSLPASKSDTVDSIADISLFLYPYPVANKTGKEERSMLAMEEVQRLRDLYYHQGITNISEIARITGYNRKTIVKYIDQEDFSPPPPAQKDETEHSLVSRSHVPHSEDAVQH